MWICEREKLIDHVETSSWQQQTLFMQITQRVCLESDVHKQCGPWCLVIKYSMLVLLYPSAVSELAINYGQFSRFTGYLLLLTSFIYLLQRNMGDV